MRYIAVYGSNTVYQKPAIRGESFAECGCLKDGVALRNSGITQRVVSTMS